ncbi:DUF3237 domain-containing protein [soil metagenome]
MDLERELTLHISLQPAIIPGDGPYGTRVVGSVDHGRAVGRRVNGEFVGAAADWMLIGKDGYGRIDVRGQIRTDDDAFIYVQYIGLLEMNERSTAALLEPGRETAWGDQYFRTTPRFETGDPRYAWMNESVFVARGRVTSDGIEYEVFRVH